MTGSELFLQRILDGLSNGALYGALALAMVVVYQASGRLNLAQGEFGTFGTYVSLVLSSPASPALAGSALAAKWLPGSAWPLWMSIIGAMVISAMLAVVVERLIVRRVSTRDVRSAVSVTIALLLGVNAFARWYWVARPRGYPTPFPNHPTDYVHLAGARLRYTTIGTWLTLLVLMGMLAFLVRRSKAGLAFRAVSSNLDNAKLMGIRTGRVLSGAWAMAAAIGTLVGCLLASRLVLEPNMMIRLITYSFAAATIGGLSSPGGALLGGLLVGVGQSMVAGYIGFIGTTMTLPATVAVMVAVLCIRPWGLFGVAKVARS
ncbi:MAG: branched-chain amino acid ABC transporter permease [Acidimicrobiales bacterium]